MNTRMQSVGRGRSPVTAATKPTRVTSGLCHTHTGVEDKAMQQKYKIFSTLCWIRNRFFSKRAFKDPSLLPNFLKRLADKQIRRVAFLLAWLVPGLVDGGVSGQGAGEARGRK